MDFTGPYQMAEVLVRRHNDLSTVHRMIAYNFGRAPSITSLQKIRDKHAKSRAAKGYGGNLNTGGHTVNFSTAAHEEAMEQGSRDLLKALWHSHQRVMLVHQAYGRQVVRP
jgi:hypothetical protein